MTGRQRMTLVSAGLCTFAALVAAITTVGQRVGIAQTLILFFGGFGAGASIASLWGRA
jgi:hypothetical protein